eukprot:12880149-Prorocentrum_lima.AAC.1
MRLEERAKSWTEESGAMKESRGRKLSRLAENLETTLKLANSSSLLSGRLRHCTDAIAFEA